MMTRPPRSTQLRSSAASGVYKRPVLSRPAADQGIVILWYKRRIPGPSYLSSSTSRLAPRRNSDGSSSIGWRPGIQRTSVAKGRYGNARWVSKGCIHSRIPPNRSGVYGSRRTCGSKNARSAVAQIERSALGREVRRFRRNWLLPYRSSSLRRRCELHRHRFVAVSDSFGISDSETSKQPFTGVQEHRHCADELRARAHGSLPDSASCRFHASVASTSACTTFHRVPSCRALSRRSAAAERMD